ncbi:hypothetical protein ANO11243_072150 [Dothideomycetidae sp. 11243]|nr:hypothetical protein ANO11243_072150 [fungal sp. No.11243]
MPPPAALPISSLAGADAQRAAKLATHLPPLLLNFFRRHPPGSFSRSTSSPAPSIPQQSSNNSTSSLTQPALDPTVLNAITAARDAANPFLPWRNPATQAWRPPRYSLRRQADLYREAKEWGVTALLPETSPRNPALKLAKREEIGLAVRGTGKGQRVKGKLWERHLRPKLEAREKAMEGMSELIKQWKQRGHGRGWKKWPR